MELPNDVARLDFILWRYPQWEIGFERPVWTATRRPTPHSLHFIYARTLNELERKLRQAGDGRLDGGDRVAPALDTPIARPPSAFPALGHIHNFRKINQ